MTRGDDRAVATVVGALLVLSILGGAILYVNAYHVPAQGEALEAEGILAAESSLRGLSDRLSGPPAPLLQELPLRPPASSSGMLGGVILSPVRAEGELAFDPFAAVARISHVVDAPASSPLGTDPNREDLGDGRMRVYTLGNRAEGRALGALELTVGGVYLGPVNYSLEGGALFAKRPTGSSLVAPPGLLVMRAGTDADPITSVAWRVPILTGSVAASGGRESAQVSVSPGPLTSAGGSKLVYSTTIAIDTRAPDAWRDAFTSVVGPHGTVTVAPSATPGVTTVTATILPPPGTPATKAAVMIDYSAVRYSLSLTERSSR